MSVGIVLLAAGSSTRMGVPKQGLTYRGRSLLRHAAETALATGCRPVVVVLGSRADELRRELDGLDVHLVENPDWADGQGGSIARGVSALRAFEPDAVLLMLCDMPLVTPDHLESIAELHRREDRALIASAYENVLGVPALFARPFFAELESLRGEAGARAILRRHEADAVSVPMTEGSLDVDTPEDYERLKEE